MSNAPIPSVLALLLCDQVITDAETNKKSLIGVFENINAPNFPVQVPSMALYAKLADAEGMYDLKVRVVRLRDESLVGEIELKSAETKDHLQPVDLVLKINGLLFPEPGKYEFQLFANEIYLGRITMHASQIEGVV